MVSVKELQASRGLGRGWIAIYIWASMMFSIVVAALSGNQSLSTSFFLRVPESLGAKVAQVALFTFGIVAPLFLLMFTKGVATNIRWVGGSVLAFSLFYSVGESNMLLPVIALVTASTFDASERGRVRRILQVLALAICLLSLVVAPFKPWFMTPGYGPRLTGIFASPNSLYPIALVGLALSMARFGARRHLWFEEFVFVATLLLTGSRAGLVALIGLVIFFTWKQRKVRPVLGLAFVVALGVITLRFSLHSNQSGVDPSAMSRITLWKYAIRELAESPLFGLGPHGFTFGRFRDEMLLLHTRMPGDPKNIFLNYWLSFGCVGIAWFTVVSSIFAKSGARLHTPLQSLLLAMLLSGIADTAFGLGDLLGAGTTFLAVAIGCSLWNETKGVEHLELCDKSEELRPKVRTLTLGD